MMTHSAGSIRHKVAIDAMGGDRGPAEVVRAVELALREIPSIEEIILVGQENSLRPLVADCGLAENPRLRLFHASEVVSMDDKPMQSLKQKKDASMFRGVELVKAGQAQALISQGNTGALMAASTLRLRPLDGIFRPALGTIWPNREGHFVLADAGANPDAKPEHLVHNAILASHYCRLALKIESPRIGLLTIGTEEGKGNELINAAHPLLKKVDGLINYVGPIEGFDVFNDVVDVVICDGFLGNVVLKTSESLFKMIIDTLKKELSANFIRKIGAAIAQPAFAAAKAHLSPDNYAGAPLLGLRGHVLKTHGSSSRYALLSAIRIATEIIQYDLNDQVLRDITLANERIRPSAPSEDSHPA